MLKLTALRDLFTPPTAIAMAQRELEEAERALLRWQTQSEDAEAMASIYMRRVARLNKILGRDMTTLTNATPISGAAENQSS